MGISVSSDTAKTWLKRVAPATAALLLVSSATLADPPQTPIRVCDESGCRTQGADEAPPSPEEDAHAAAQDSDTYRGEPRDVLEQRFADGDPVAAYKLGMVAQYGIGGMKIDERAAVRYYEAAAAQNHAWAQFRLGVLLTNGRTVRDPQRAMEMFFAAAKGGQPQAANNIGLAYLTGHGLPRDVNQAVHWLLIAANGGVAEAKYNLGIIYLRGDADGQDLEKGWKWIKAAADSNNLGADKVVGRIYMTGLDTISQDMDEAQRWLEPPAQKGDKEARAWLKQIRAAQAHDRKVAEALQREEADTMRMLAAAVLVSALSPPPTIIVSTW
ncbi:MAG TPA: tetratricopeptide repeat protein [Rhizomicrobium sp.]|jgi:hypothetical protein|nr:tetratricopeptide repeat protein [Rhizomicrobium sp.]